MAPIVELNSVGVSLGGRPALRDLTFSVERGEMLGLIGPNGAGKTTLLRTLLGMHRPCAGSLAVLGRDPSALKGAGLARFRLRVGYVPQLDARQASVPLTVREVVEISRAGRAGLMRRLRPKDRAAVDAWLSRMGLVDLADRPYGELSGGQQRKVQLARALAQEPDVLLMDEPAANLDLAWQETLIRLIEQVSADTGVTMLLVTHDLSLLPASCGRILVLADGTLKAIGPTGEVLVPEVLLALYGTSVRIECHGGRYHVLPAAGQNSDA